MFRLYYSHEITTIHYAELWNVIFGQEVGQTTKEEVGLLMAAEVWGGDNADKIQH